VRTPAAYLGCQSAGYCNPACDRFSPVPAHQLNILQRMKVPIAEYVGELYLADISVPPSLYAELALALEVGSLFAESEILPLRS
jgi:hypothetical protein